MKPLVFLGFMFIFGCSSPSLSEQRQESANMPLNSRTLEVSQTAPALNYPFRVCARKFLGVCTRWELMVDVYDLTDNTTRKSLVGFVCKQEENP